MFGNFSVSNSLKFVFVPTCKVSQKALQKRKECGLQIPYSQCDKTEPQVHIHRVFTVEENFTVPIQLKFLGCIKSRAAPASTRPRSPSVAFGPFPFFAISAEKRARRVYGPSRIGGDAVNNMP